MVIKPGHCVQKPSKVTLRESECSSNTISRRVTAAIVIAILFCTGNCFGNSYSKRYERECAAALDFYFTNATSLDSAARSADLSGAFLFAIAAPEFTRFGYLRNKAEVLSLKGLYVQYGKAYADFSVGIFQMKPSFVERMEDSLKRHIANGELCKFGDCLIRDPGSREARAERVKRLDNKRWQIRYLSLFCALVGRRFPQTECMNDQVRLAFYASAYNTGFHRSAEAIERIGRQASFPGFSYNKYRYCDISLWFYRRCMEKLPETSRA